VKRIAVVHPDITLNGGGEAVCAHVLDALCDSYDLTLVTWLPPEFGTLDALYGTTLASKRLSVVTVGERQRYPKFLTSRSVIRYALAVRYVQDHLDQYDAVVSTWCEIAVDKPAIQYVHVPLFLPGVPHEVLSGQHISRRQQILWRALRLFARLLGRGSYTGYQRSMSIANSTWTVDLIRSILHVEPDLIWPPIPKPSLRKSAWSERRNGFVVVGRLVPGKRILELIDCIGRVRETHPDVTLHIVGSGTGQYAEAVRERCKASEFATYEGRLSNEALFELFARNKYGIHGFPHEHFGIALGQMVMAGCLCFAPAGGGQAELLANRSEMLYQDFDDAVAKIVCVLEDGKVQEELLTALEPIKGTLERHDFQQSFREAVDRHVETAGRDLLSPVLL
jgi:glycosyltransferase involved in cell wall biosynthesis